MGTLLKFSGSKSQRQTSSAVATHAKGTATQPASINGSNPTWEKSLSPSLRNFARALFSERIHRLSNQMPLGLGFDSEVNSGDLDTMFCHSESVPVALAMTIDGKDCSCLRSHPTPIASDHKGSTGKGCRYGSLAEHVAMQCGQHKTCYPNPEYVEQVMGFPIGWSDLQDLETQSMSALPNSSAEQS
jgi:hypothetical protein